MNISRDIWISKKFSENSVNLPNFAIFEMVIFAAFLPPSASPTLVSMKFVISAVGESD